MSAVKPAPVPSAGSRRREPGCQADELRLHQLSSKGLRLESLFSAGHPPVASPGGFVVYSLAIPPPGKTQRKPGTLAQSGIPCFPFVGKWHIICRGMSLGERGPRSWPTKFLVP